MKTLLLIAMVFCTSLAFSQGQRMFRLSTSTTVAVDSGFATDTLRLASTQYSWIKVRGRSGTTDSVKYITGGLSYGVYVFSAAADDTTIVLIDGGNLKLSGSLTLDALTDMVMLFFDGTNFRQLTAVVSND